MRAKTRELALSGVMTALGVVLLCLGGIVPLALYVCPILTSLTLLIVREECCTIYGWCCYCAMALLGLLLCPDKEMAAVFLFLGYYPLLKPQLDCIAPKLVMWLVKLLLAGASMGAMYALLLFVFRLEAVVQEMAQTGRILLWMTALLGVVLFAVYDVLLSRLTVIYRRRKDKRT